MSQAVDMHPPGFEGLWAAHTPQPIHGWLPDALPVGRLPLELSGLPEEAEGGVLGDSCVIATGTPV